MKFYTKYSPPMGSTIDQTGQKSKTRQSEMDSCDINKIMERFNRTGQLPQIQSLPPQYGDARVVDYATAMDIVKTAKDAFNALPAKTRQYFGHDPQAYLKGIQDHSEENVKQLLKLGILVERQETPEMVLKTIAKNTEKEPKQKHGNSPPT